MQNHLKTLFEKRVLVIGNHDNYKANVMKLLQPEEGVNFVVEISNYGKWFRILRLKNYRRTHDFIINECKTCEIIVENDKSQTCIVQLGDLLDIREMFKGIKLYVQYERKGDYYVPKESTLTMIESLYDFWQRDLNQKNSNRKQIEGNIFTDTQGRKWEILKGHVPTKLGEHFIWLKKPNKGVHITAEFHHFKEQKIDTTGMYPLELIRTEKFIATVILRDLI